MAPLDRWMTGLPSDATVADAARLAITSRVADVLQSLPDAAEQADQDIEHVHRLRVATRRACAVLKIYEIVYPRKRADRLAWSLKTVRRAAGPARDLDVFLARLTKEPNAPDALLERLRAERSAAQSELVRLHQELKRGRKLKRRVDKLVIATPADSKRAQRYCDTLLSDWAHLRFDKAVDKFAHAAPDENSTADALHQFRIHGKRLRYTIEALAPCLPDDFREHAYPELKELQDRLGSVNDHEAAAFRLRGWLAGASPEQRLYLERRIAAEHRDSVLATREFYHWWDAPRRFKLMSALRVAC